MKRQVMIIFIALGLLCVLWACDNNRVAENYQVPRLANVPQGFVQPMTLDETTLQRMNDLQENNDDEIYYLQTAASQDVGLLAVQLWQHKLKIESFEETENQISLLVKKVYNTEKEVFQIVENQPEPKDGLAAFYSYIQQNLVYPAQAREQGVEGKVYIRFVVGKDGSLEDVMAVKGIGAGCDAEAERVTKMAPDWQAGTIADKAVKVRMILPISFKLSGDDIAENATADVMPQPIGGQATFMKYVHDNIKYPEGAKSKGLEGKVFVEFTVKKDGSLADFMLKKGVDKSLDAEALRVMRNSPAWKPGSKDGQPVNVKMILPITFKLS